MSVADRVALIVVHGIADQQPGQTVRELARLLCHGATGAPRFVQGEMHQVLVPVTKLEPGDAPASRGRTEPESDLADHGPTSAGESARRRPGTPSGFYQAQTGRGHRDVAVPPGPARDLGVELNDYLLSRHELSEGDALYEAVRVSLRRRSDNGAVDLYEMYWADLSRLAGGGLQALSSLYQLFFHLSTLAADIVDQTALSEQGGRGWRLLQAAHAWVAWLMKAPAFLLQLCMLLVMLFATSSFVPYEQQPLVLTVVFAIGVIVALVLAVLARLHGANAACRWRRPVSWLLVALVSGALAVLPMVMDRGFGYLYLAAGALATGLLGAVVVEHYTRMTQGVRLCGHVLVAATVIALGIEAWRVLPTVTTVIEWTYTAALHVGELLLAAMLLVWSAFCLAQLVIFPLGLWLQRDRAGPTRASLHTARLALVVSSGMFAVLSLVLWSVISYVVGLALTEVRYFPLVFGHEHWSSATFFLEDRVRGLGSFFTPLVIVSSLLGLAALLVLAPSLSEELSPTRNLDAAGVRCEAKVKAQNLAHWLGGGLQLLDRILVVVVPLAGIVGAVLFLAFVAQQTIVSFGWLFGAGGAGAGWLDRFQGETLVAAGKWLAGGALVVTALGARFSRTLGRLRVVIDAVLDIDNYFADPPDHQPPRARIFARFASLLAHLRAQGYRRFVIVAHSQGTVISAELLHYLHVQSRLPDYVGATPIALVTLGSPLRELYAVRFPLLYPWMGATPARFDGASPGVADLGVGEWTNSYRAGDYVGRSIWTPVDDPACYDVASIDAGGVVQARRSDGRGEFCLGAGAHTRYFANDAVALAAEIERLSTLR